MDAQPHPMSAEAFLAWSLAQPEGRRHELMDGRVVAMASEGVRHALVKGEVFAQLRAAVRAGGLACQVFPDGMAVQIDAHTVYEPDAALRCGVPLDDELVAYSDPVAVVEVLSPSTSALDGAGKLADYFRLPSLQHYLIVHPGKNRVIHHQRDGADIRTRLVSSGMLALDPPGVTLDVASLFA